MAKQTINRDGYGNPLVTKHKQRTLAACIKYYPLKNNKILQHCKLYNLEMNGMLYFFIFNFIILPHRITYKNYKNLTYKMGKYFFQSHQNRALFIASSFWFKIKIIHERPKGLKIFGDRNICACDKI